MFGLVNFLGNLLLALFLFSITQFCLHIFSLLSVGYCCLFCRIRTFRYVNCRKCRALTPRHEGILFFTQLWTTAMALTIASLNVRGLRDNLKRREVFTWLRSKKYSIYMLQECHCTENTNPVWSAEWGYQAIFSTFSSNKLKQGFAFFLTTPLICTFKNSLLTPLDASSYATSKQIQNL